MREEKPCSKCGETKLLSEFYKDRRRKDGKQAECKACCNARAKAYRVAHKEGIRVRKKAYYAAYGKERRAYQNAYCAAHKEEARARRLVRRAAARAFVDAYKAEHGCSGSGPCKGVLGFHHLGKKNHQVADMVVQGRASEVIEAEIKLCIVLCAACHARLHNKERVQKGETGDDDD